QNRHLHVTKTLDRLIDRHSRKVQKILPTFASRDLDLHIKLEKLPRGKQYHSVLVLTMPQNAIRVEEIESNPAICVLRSFEELLRKVKKFKSQLNRERFWRKETTPRRETPSADTTRELENAINHNLDQVENYIRRELYHHVVTNNIPPGLLQTQALLDEVFLEVSSKVSSKPENVPLEQWMCQIARSAVNRRIESVQKTRNEPHVEERAPVNPRWEDEELNFHQPDEVLHLEDLIRDEHSVTPEELLVREEAQEEFHNAIARLSGAIRESFILFCLEGFNSDEVAMITAKNPGQVLEDVEKARMELRQQIEIQ
ncbi:sigma-70 family RNA polymerase sigma factor, partial [Acidobacteria bacterium AH-259-D05]|nr:sigma-70 family RNA polymerase sigma factor [Acidobacteria bacterium AH-259-D05]